MPERKYVGDLTFRELEVLEWFLSFHDALAYPTLIARHSDGLISKPTAKSICEKYRKKGILKTRKLKPAKRGVSTTHYYVDRDITTLYKIIEVMDIKNRIGWQQSLLSKGYIQKQIDINLVKKIISEKKKSINTKALKDEEDLLLIILALIQTSGSALVEFLFGYWKPYYDCPRCDNFSWESNCKNGGIHEEAKIDDLIFSLAVLFINYLINSQRILPPKSLVINAFVRGGRDKQLDDDTLLTLELKDGRFIHIDGSTDTTHYKRDSEGIHIGFPSEDRINWHNTRVKFWIEEPKAYNSHIKLILPDSTEWRKQKPEKKEITDMQYPRVSFARPVK